MLILTCIQEVFNYNNKFKLYTFNYCTISCALLKDT